MLTRPTPDTVRSNLGAIVPELEIELGRVLEWWAQRVVVADGKRICGEISNAGIAQAEADVGAVYLARILWTFSRAAQNDDNADYRRIADIAYAQLNSDFLDRENGGIFWKTNAAGAALIAKKQAYAQAFALYGLSAYAKLNTGEEVEALCHHLFDLLEARFHDDEHGGYWEAFTRDWQEIEDVRLSERDHHAPKSMNTHLHVMEAYSEYYRCFQRAEARQALRNLIGLFAERIYMQDQGHLRMFWSDEWENMSTTISFGHDIEASWLIQEAAELVGDDDLLAEIRPLVLTLVDNCEANGIGPNGEIFEEADARHPTRIWWCQAEALVGFVNAFQLRGDRADMQSALASWEFIKSAVIDAPDGEWRWHSALDEGFADPYIGGEWKACYHNSRALMEAGARIRSLIET